VTSEPLLVGAPVHDRTEPKRVQRAAFSVAL
jgi:hypothetical protein